MSGTAGAVIRSGALASRFARPAFARCAALASRGADEVHTTAPAVVTKATLMNSCASSLPSPASLKTIDFDRQHWMRRSWMSRNDRHYRHYGAENQTRSISAGLSVPSLRAVRRLHTAAVAYGGDGKQEEKKKEMRKGGWDAAAPTRKRKAGPKFVDTSRTPQVDMRGGIEAAPVENDGAGPRNPDAPEDDTILQDKGILMLEDAVEAQDTDLVKRLLGENSWLANRTAGDLKETPTHMAVIRPNTEILEVMLYAKGDPNVLDMNGHSVLHWLILKHEGLSEMEIASRCELLLGKARANHKLKDKEGKTARDHADVAGYRRVVALLDDVELDWQESKIRENRQANGRAMVVGGIWGTAACVSLLIPPIFEQWTMGGDPTAMLAAGTFVGSTGVLGAFFHKHIVESWSDFEGKISLAEGILHGLAVGVGVHFAVPILSVVGPEVVSHGLQTYEGFDWATQFPADMYNYGGSMAWWGIYGIGAYTIPGCGGIGLFLSQLSTACIYWTNYSEGDWSDESFRRRSYDE